jgi:hypothetical protein
MNHDRIATLLASGLLASQVATIVGVSPARITQLQKEEGFAEILAGKQAEVAAKDIEEISLSAKYTAVEHLLIEQMVQMAPVSELRDVTAALRVVAERQEKAKSRMNPILQQSPVLNNIVQLILPSHAIPELALNAEREVIAIGNRNLAPLSSSGVLSLFATPALNAIPANLNAGEYHEPARIQPSTEADAPETLPSTQGITAGAMKFLDSLHPAPFAASF